MGSNFIVFSIAIISLIIILVKLFLEPSLIIKKIRPNAYHILLLTSFFLSQALVKFSYKYGDLTMGIQTRMGITFLPFIVLSAVYFFKQVTIETNKNHKVFISLFCIFVLLFNLPNASKNWSASTTHGYISFKTIMEYLKSEMPYKDDYIIVSPQANWFIPFGYNAIYPNTFAENYQNIMKDINENKTWQFPLIIQEVDFQNKPSEDSLIIKNQNLPIKVVYEKMVKDDWYLRFLIIQNKNMLQQ